MITSFAEPRSACSTAVFIKKLFFTNLRAARPVFTGGGASSKKSRSFLSRRIVIVRLVRVLGVAVIAAAASAARVIVAALVVLVRRRLCGQRHRPVRFCRRRRLLFGNKHVYPSGNLCWLKIRRKQMGKKITKINSSTRKRLAQIYGEGREGGESPNAYVSLNAFLRPVLSRYDSRN